MKRSCPKISAHSIEHVTKHVLFTSVKIMPTRYTSGLFFYLFSIFFLRLRLHKWRISDRVCFLCWCCKTFSGLKFKLSEYLKFLLNKQPCNQIYPFVTNIYRFLSTFWKLTVLFFFFLVGNLMVSIGTWKKEFFQYGENLNVQFLAFNDFLNSFFLDLLMNQVNHYQICFLFFKLSRQGLFLCLFSTFSLRRGSQFCSLECAWRLFSPWLVGCKFQKTKLVNYHLRLS